MKLDGIPFSDRFGRDVKGQSKENEKDVYVSTD